jgi:hypothetical protein
VEGEGLGRGPLVSFFLGSLPRIMSSGRDESVSDPAFDSTAEASSEEVRSVTLPFELSFWGTTREEEEDELSKYLDDWPVFCRF